jgi:hypothetical protein
MLAHITWRDVVMTEERDIDEAMGFEFIAGEWVPIFELTPDQEFEVYAAGAIGPEGMTIAHSAPPAKPT